MEIPADPPELATWRALIERRDALVAEVRFGEEAGANAKRAIAVMREQYGDDLTDADYEADEAELRDSFARAGVEARHELALFDVEISARSERAHPPGKLRNRQHKPMMLKAVDAVKRYLSAPSVQTGTFGWLSVRAVARRELSPSEFEALITSAKAWRAESIERSGTMVACHVVNTAAGLDPTARLTRP